MEEILRTEALRKYFQTSAGSLQAVENIDLSIQKGKTLGVVGESGCGKSTLGRTILRLVEPTDGKIFFRGQDITKLKPNELTPYRRKMQMIFQDPYSSINPRLTVKKIIQEPLLINERSLPRAQRDVHIEEVMRSVDLSPDLSNVYPHELDGGTRQRVGIARALSLQPELIVCDEPVSALDVSIQAQILNLLMDLQESLNLTYIFISHNLSVVKHISNEIMVMYLGECVERAPSKDLFLEPMHPYTIALLDAIPQIGIGENRKPRKLLHGEVRSPINLPKGCRFVSRCAYANSSCSDRNPNLKEVKPGHFVSCLQFVQMD